MCMRKTDWPIDREIRLRFILFAVIDAASVQGVPAELLLAAHKLLHDSPTDVQLRNVLSEILDTEEMFGFRFSPGSETEEFMQMLEKPVDPR